MIVTLLVIWVILGQIRHVYGSGEQCTRGLVYVHCYDQLRYINGHWTTLDECCKLNGTWYCVSNANIHPCEDRGFTTTIKPKEPTTSAPYTLRRTTFYWPVWRTTFNWPYGRTTTYWYEWPTAYKPKFPRYKTRSETSSVVSVTAGVGAVIALLCFVCCVVFIRYKRHQYNRNQSVGNHRTRPPQTQRPIYFIRDQSSVSTHDVPNSNNGTLYTRDDPPSYDDVVKDEQIAYINGGIQSDDIPSHPPPQYHENTNDVTSNESESHTNVI